MPAISCHSGSRLPHRRWRALIALCAATSLGAHRGHAQGSQHVDTVSPPTQVVSAPWGTVQSGWAGRVVVGEYETGIFCGPCQRHDEAFNGLLRRYPGTVFLTLAYHEEINAPLGDPADSNQAHIFGWYGFPGSADHPGLFHGKGLDDWIDGVSTPAAAEDKFMAQHLYETMVSAIDAELRRPPEAFFHVQATVQAGHIFAQARVDSVTGRHPTVLLRLLLVEDTVRLVSPHIEEHGTLPDSQGVSHPVVIPLRREHHMVVRAYAHIPGFSLGLPVQVPGTAQYTFDVGAIQQRHLHYHQVALQQGPVARNQDSVRRYLQPYMNADDLESYEQVMGMFTDQHDWEINPMRLHIVAFVQDAHSGEVLQAAMIPVGGRSLVLP